ncbi:MAG: xanthine dehydrogenase family protein subunit M [Desulfarculus sp.]|nr:MAG: xanthine dehydrogenase family protein subunit M [Desulfarculus sp.]
MLLPKFDYHQPRDLPAACGLLAELGPEARVIAGGTDLLVNLKHGRIRPKALVGLERLEELTGLDSGRGRLFIGARTSAAHLAASRSLGGGLRLLAQAAGQLGSPQVRNRATIGGNLCTARPAAELPPPLLCLDARALLAGPQGQREVALSAFFKGPGLTVLGPDEIMRGVVIPRPGLGGGGAYLKLGLRRAMEISLVNVAAFLQLAPDGRTIAQARVALGAVAPTPILSPRAAQALIGQRAGDKLFAAAAEAAARDARPIDDHRGSAAYRRDMVRVLARRALEQAWDQARGRRGGKS